MPSASRSAHGIRSEPLLERARIVGERQAPIGVDDDLLFNHVLHGPRHEPRLVEAPLGERLHALDGDVADYLEPLGGGREVDERQRIAVQSRT